MTEFLQHVADAMSLGSMIALVAVGVALVAGVLNLVNFAHGEFLMVAGYTVLLVSPIGFWWAVAAAIVVTVVLAVLMERLAFRPLAGTTPSTLLIASFAVSSLLQNIANVTFGSKAQTVAVPAVFAGTVDIGGLRIASVNAITIVATVVMLLLLIVLLRATGIGLEMRAASEDMRLARLAAIPAQRVVAAGFIVGGIFAGIAGVLLLASTGSVTPTIGFNPLLLAFVAMVLGGIGSIGGAVIGAYGLGILTSVFGGLVPADVQPFRDAFVFVIVIVVLLFLPNGISGRASTAERV